MAQEIIKVPDLGGDGGEVVEINVAPGDVVSAEDTVMTLESDKATMEIPAPKAGKVVDVLVKVGDTLNEGMDMLLIETEAAESPEPALAPVEDAPAEQPAPVVEAAPAVAAESSSTQTVEVRVPDIGGDKAPVVEISVAVGDEVQVDDALITLESDKATMEVPSTHAGKVVAVNAAMGAELGEGDLVVTLEVQGVAPAPTQTPAEQSAPVASAPAEQKPQAAASVVPAAQASQPQAAPVNAGVVYAGPAVRRIAREFGVDLTLVKGTGPKGRILKEDVQSYVKEQLSKPAVAANASVTSGSGIPAIPEVDFSQWGDIEVQPLNKLRKVAAENFQRSWLNIPHVTQFDDADITELEAFRKAQKAVAEAKGVKLTPLPFLLKAAAYALKEMPQFCASLSADGQNRILKNYVNIGIAVDTPDGLVVPVLKDVDKKGLWELAAECAELADKARNKKLKPAEMKGGCFTLSSLGSIGGTAFTPIVNSPEVAILGISKASMKPFWNGSEFVPRLMLPLSLSYDHRAINGAEAAQFAVLLSTLLADIRKLLL
ncbi:dihydrolipoyllysine-residue acetyltransferase [Parendozoicomonas haliclonae]|uniref:Acetyltransferase component of pyruvate dehydrogenase complex n=1 Tax=Parendozoicomonas haliclonae TaxID=1960125 RepID=A0A1X7AIX5_9GAMM|nr:dihydrolipoyllysine-residue acetyltransferase [Parendozoicomonas haliclonae]SMA45711.1 Dihydrolipoyllysine-residue acetyltransferase component of pyruvate dehydrogenase complex [Parendozoicomonas haliclonae]